MLRNDPMTHGRDLYLQHCTSCHILDGEGEQKAPTHTGFGSREWILALLRTPQADHFLGKVENAEDMPSQSRLGEEALVAVTELLYAQGAETRERGEIDEAKARAGERVMRDRCMECHTWFGEGDEMGIGAPPLTWYPSRTWMRRQIERPDAPTQYGELNEMPSFADELDAHDLDMVTAYLRRQRRRGDAFLEAHPPGGAAAAAAPATPTPSNGE
jgi:mono/diheme cytochrome c family protein